MIKHILALLLMLCATAAQAQSYFVCDCGTGSEVDCQAGSVGNTGTSAASPKQLWSELPDINTRAAGTTVSFCKGGSVAWSLVRLENPNSTKASPITFTSYDPVAWTGTARPILLTSGITHATASAFEFGGFFDEVDDVGYVFRGLHLLSPNGPEGMSSSSRGWLIWGVVDAVLFEDNEVEGFVFGWEMTNGTDGGDPQLGTGFILRNNHIHHNGMGVLGSRQDLTIEGNLIEYNNNGCVTCSFQHGLYIGTGRGFASDNPAVYSSRTIIRNNILRNNSLNASGNCEGGSFTSHGRFDQFIVEGNLIETTTGTSTTSCYGMSLNAGYGPEAEHIKRLVVRGNTVANVGNVCLESDIGMGSALIENNKCVKTVAGGNAPNIAVTLTSEAASLTAGANANNTTIRNNTFYCTVDATGTCGVSVSTGTGHSVFNNISYIGASGTANCWAPSALSNFTLWDNNQCYELGSGQWSSSYADRTAACVAGFDCNGASTDPGFSTTPSAANGWDLSLGANVTGRNTDKPPRDALYCQRSNPPTRGAIEFSPSSCTSIRSPVNF